MSVELTPEQEENINKRIEELKALMQEALNGKYEKLIKKEIAEQQQNQYKQYYENIIKAATYTNDNEEYPKN